MSEKIMGKYDEFDFSEAKEYVKNVASGVAKIEKDVDMATLEGKESAKKGNYLMIGPKGETYPTTEEFFQENYVPATIEQEKFVEGIQQKLTQDSLNVIKTLGITMKEVKPFIKVTPVKAVELTEDVELVTDWGNQKGEKGKAFMMFYGSKKEIVDGKEVVAYDRAICQKDEETGLPIGYIKAPVKGKEVKKSGPEFEF